ncbi:nucleotide binding protein 1-like protein [Planoprotostelium fungivorum]|uniref:mevalonate kinase n=1 Tax=Planoprotostelium fungivorum TaxID=1890364 RepID=A0A2P6NYC7_9EUKA|nr:nucleotide binding protein 1-like protein [Planoprotostelium fungivorum]
MSRIKASAPGKVILFGEHSVVYGKKAIATAVDLRTHCTLSRQDAAPDTSRLIASLADVSIHLSWDIADLLPFRDADRDVTVNRLLSSTDDLIERGGGGPAVLSAGEKKAVVVLVYLYLHISREASNGEEIRLDVMSSLPIGAGMGSSAAYCVSISSVLLADLHSWNVSALDETKLQNINDWAFSGERILHGTPSGVDNTVSTYGRTISFSKSQGIMSIDHIRVPQLKYLLINTMVPRSTSELVKRVKDRLEEYPEETNDRLQRMDEIAHRFKKISESVHITEEDYHSIDRLIEENQSILDTLGVGHEKITKIKEIARRHGYASKLTGAGGGGCTLIFLRDRSSEEVVSLLLTKELTNEGFVVYPISVSSEGVIIQNVKHPHLSKLGEILHIHKHEEQTTVLEDTSTGSKVHVVFAEDRVPNASAHDANSPSVERARFAAQPGFALRPSLSNPNQHLELSDFSSSRTVDFDEDYLEDIHNSQRLDIGSDSSKYDDYMPPTMSKPSGAVKEEDYLEDIHNSQRLDIGSDSSKFDDYMPPTMSKPSGAVKIDVRRVRILYNPMSGAKKGEAFAKESKIVLEANGIQVDMVPLERKGHGEELCETMSVEGIDVVCCLGGDGTFHECVNGYMKRQDDARLRVPLAVLPGGTGNSFALELSGSTKLKVALEHIMRGLAAPIDIGEMYFPTDNSKIYSFNSLHWGMASKVNVTAEKLRWMGKAIRYTTAALVELLKGTKTLAIIEGIGADGKRFELRDEFSVCIANLIQTAAKGMKLAPDAKLNDGLIDVILIRSSHTGDLAKVFKKFYDGTHKELEFVDYIQCKSFSIIPFQKDDPTLISEESDPQVSEEILDIDGELKGITPFKCTVLQKSLAGCGCATKEDDTKSLLPEECPSNTDQQGRGTICQGCPGQETCKSGTGVQPDAAKIALRMNPISHKILVLSGKGGVGKSTVATQLSLALSRRGKKVGILDVDICGPSVPQIMGVPRGEIINSNWGWLPVKHPVHPVSVMSVGFMNSTDRAVIWRGPKKTNLIRQFLSETFWSKLDYLLFDTPPGTSDEHISVVSALKNSNPDGALIVTTGNGLSLTTVGKEITFCRKIGIPILGIIENMSSLVCPCCDEQSELYPSDACASFAEKFGVPFLGKIPLDQRVTVAMDTGQCPHCAHPDSPTVAAVEHILDRITGNKN